MRVLLVEDEAGVRLMIASGLARAGYDVIDASDGSAALRLLEEGTLPDILITDIRMPGADGWTVARAYRARLPDLPVLYVTGFADENNPVPGGVILPKPFQRGGLLSKPPHAAAIEGASAGSKQGRPIHSFRLGLDAP
jgi:CheY-like chemotaxis protein